MGTWNSRLFGNDLACDIRDDYIDLLRAGRSDEQAELELLALHQQAFCETGDEPLLWLALAITEWNHGRLSSTVRAKALEWIDQSPTIELWDDTYTEFRRELDNIRAKLLEPQPGRKRIGKIRHIHAPWKPGDLLCLKLPGNMKKASSFNGKYALLHVTEIRKNHSNRFESDEQSYDDVVCLDILNWFGAQPPSEDFPIESLRNFIFEASSSRSHGPKYNALKLYLFPGDEKLLQASDSWGLRLLRSGVPTSPRVLCDGEDKAQRATLSSLGNQVGLALHSLSFESDDPST